MAKSYKGKILLLILATTGVALAIAVLAFTVHDYKTVSEGVKTRLMTQARIVSEGSETALLFNDQNSADEALHLLHADPAILQAAIYDQKGQRFVSYHRNNESVLAPALDEALSKVDSERRVITVPVMYLQEPIGHILVVASNDEVVERLKYFSAISIVILFVASLLSIVVTRRLQDNVLEPVLSLTSIASQVKDTENYDLRAERHSDDELGALTSVFNEMLEKVQQRDQYLAALVKERTQQLENKNSELLEEIEIRNVMFKKLEESEARFESSFNQYAIGMLLLNNEQQIMQANDAFYNMMEYEEGQLLGKSLFQLVDPEDEFVNHDFYDRLVDDEIQHYQLEQQFIKNTGAVLWGLLDVSAVRQDGKFVHAMAQIQDVTEAKELSTQLSYQASHDPLTDLINRREFEEQLKHLLQYKPQVNRDFEHALLYIDLDQFKVINDTCGHTAGDELLRQVAALMNRIVRQTDTLARLGGDEFGVLMRFCQPEQSQRLAELLREAIEEFRFAWQGQTFNIGASIGITSIDNATNTTTEIMKRADAACYMAKESGRNRIHFFHDADETLAQRQGEMQWVSRINGALEEDRFHLYAQAIMNIESKQNSHYEMLVRMEDEEGKIFPPGAFLPAAERYNLISKLDRWVINKSLGWLAEQSRISTNSFVVSINISGLSFNEKGFTDYVLRLLQKYQVRNERVCFEITETAAIANLSSVTDFINKLKQQGCLFALDDFGSGMSSFAYLKNLAVDYLKIDGMFVKDILDDPIDFEMVKSINEIGHVMGKKTIAEFVENDEILAMLEHIGVDYAQGFGIGMPIPVSSVKESI